MRVGFGNHGVLPTVMRLFPAMMLAAALSAYDFATATAMRTSASCEMRVSKVLTNEL